MIPTSVVVGPFRSQLTGDELELVLTGLVRPSVNRKTGPMVQASIIVAGKPVLDVWRTEQVRAICGDCPHSMLYNKTCYVNGQMLLPLNNAHKFERVTLKKAAELVSYGRGLRLGAYGDPAALPFEVWEELVKGVRFTTGYTHQWRTCDPRFKKLVMASVDSTDEREAARASGWRCFRIRPADSKEVLTNEMVCPYEANALQCVECKQCQGAQRRGPDIVVTVHGHAAKKFGSLPVIRVAA